MLFAFVGSKTKRTVTINDANISNLRVGATCTAGYRLDQFGDIYHSNSAGTYSDQGDWISPKGAAGADYEVRATLNSGTLTGGTTGSWVGLSGAITWYCERSLAGTQGANLTIEIRNASSMAVLDSATVVLSATYES